MTSFITQLLVFLTTFFIFLTHSQHADAQGLGVTIDRNMYNAPDPKAIRSLLRQNNMRRVRVNDASSDRDLLTVLQDTGIDVLVGMNNDDAYQIAADMSSNKAAKWLEDNIKPFYDRVDFRCLQIGSKLVQKGYDARLAALRALVRVQAAQQRLGLDISLGIDMDTDSLTEFFPPSAAAFDGAALPVLRNILSFMQKNRGTLIVTIYPMIRYVTDPYYEYNGTSIDYALLSGDTPVVTDNGLQYTNMMDGLVDAFYTAMSKLGIKMRVMVGETGWASADGPRYATQKLAGEYLYNLAARLRNNIGTPLNPDRQVETFIHTLYVQDKIYKGMDKWYGLFYPNGSVANPYLSLQEPGEPQL